MMSSSFSILIEIYSLTDDPYCLHTFSHHALQDDGNKIETYVSRGTNKSETIEQQQQVMILMNVHCSSQHNIVSVDRDPIN